jgi:hypothetical protein
LVLGGINDNEVTKPVFRRQFCRAKKAEIRCTFSARGRITAKRDLKDVVT